MSPALKIISVLMPMLVALPISIRAADCRVALQYLQMEGSGKTEEANKLLVIPEEFAQFRDRPAFVPGRKPDSITDEEFATLRALGALIHFELLSCNSGFLGTVAQVRLTRPDVLQLFPHRTDGVALILPKDDREREQWTRILRSHYGELSKIPLVVENYPLPIISTSSGAKVGIPR